MAAGPHYRIVQTSPGSYRVERAITSYHRPFWRPWRRIERVRWVGIDYPAPSKPWPSLAAALEEVHNRRTYPIVIKQPA